jgi:hypothetical protein
MMLPNMNPGQKNLFILLPLMSVLVLSGITSCQRKPHYEADISDIQAEHVHISRYEEVLFSINPYMLRQEIEPFIEEFEFFLGDGIDEPMGQQQLLAYITDPLLIDLYHDTREVWPSLEELEASFTKAFRFYRAHFPTAEIPRIYSYISGIDYDMPVKFADNHLVIGLDNYLGTDYYNYRRLNIPAYQSQRMKPGYLLTDALRMLAEKHVQAHEPEPETLLDFMIYEGKLSYFLDCLLPHHPDSVKINYSARQQEWMEVNQGQVWIYLLDNELLFSGDLQMIGKFVGDGPFTSPFSRNSAPRAASWVGWQIVREYMRRNPGVTLPALMAEQDSQMILHESRYRGR